MKIFVMVMVNGWAELVKFLPFTTLEAAQEEMKSEYDKELEYQDEGSYTASIKDREACYDDEGTGVHYSWEIKEIDTDKLI